MILDRIVEDKKLRLKEEKRKIPLEDMKGLGRETPVHPASLLEALKKPGISIIGEFKQASPSLGNIKSQIGLKERIGEYAQSVDAISCLTEEKHFLGSTEYLKEIRGLCGLPILRKDFMIDEYQFYEARAIGANGVLLITAILEDEQMKEFYQLSRELGLDVLVEVHDEEELLRALKLKPDIVGVNNRDLRDFTIRLETTRRLAALVPKETVLVSESGILSPEDVKFLTESRVDGLLVGRALMEAEQPKELAKQWKAL